jgi:uncharacterized protein (UPF0335 family)
MDRALNPEDAMAKRGRKPKLQEDAPKIGHNSGQITDDNRKKLHGYVAEIERIEERIAKEKEDLKAIFESAKDSNFDVKAIRAVVKERRVDKDKREAFAAVLDAYRHALGMLADLPLGQSAIERAQQAA